MGFFDGIKKIIEEGNKREEQINKKRIIQLLNIVRREQHKGNYAEAIRAADMAIKIAPKKCYEGWFYKGAINSEFLNKQNDAVICYNKALDIISALWEEEEKPLTSSISGFYQAYSQKIQTKKDLQNARVVALNGKGLVLEKMGKKDEALSCYQELLKTGFANDLANSQITRLSK